MKYRGYSFLPIMSGYSYEVCKDGFRQGFVYKHKSGWRFKDRNGKKFEDRTFKSRAEAAEGLRRLVCGEGNLAITERETPCQKEEKEKT